MLEVIALTGCRSEYSSIKLFQGTNFIIAWFIFVVLLDCLISL
jgi:hypothetical protein